MSHKLFSRWKAISFTLMLLSCTACYHMPNDDEFSVVPLTNSPDFKGAQADPLTPNMSY